MCTVNPQHLSEKRNSLLCPAVIATENGVIVINSWRAQRAAHKMLKDCISLNAVTLSRKLDSPTK